MEIKILEGEYWYGSCKSDITIDTTVNMTPNQAMPLLISSKGRYIWEESGFKAVFREGIIRVPDTCEISEACGSLKQGYMKAMKAHFPFRNATPIPFTIHGLS